jgi:Domain of unknown function (DUF4157)
MSTFAAATSHQIRLSRSLTVAPARVLQRKCACGGTPLYGGQCAECRHKNNPLRHASKETASTITPRNSSTEEEASRTADQIMAKPANAVVSVTPQRIQRFAAHEPEGASMAPASVDEVLTKSGTPLDAKLQNEMAQRFGRDFSQVRLHLGTAAEQSAKQVDAYAYTVGNNIIFGAGQFAPNSHDGRRLIAHELTHVIQQGASGDVLQRQPAPGSKPAPRPDPVPGLGPARATYVEDLIKEGDFDGAINSLLGFKYIDYEVDLNLLADRRMIYDPSLRSSDGSTSMPAWDYLSTPPKAKPATVRIGPGAFSSLPYLYSVIMHEYQHVLWQQSLPNQKESNLLHSQGFATPDEVEAGAWELLHATESGIGGLPDKVAQIWENLNDFFWKLDAQSQAQERALVVRAFQKAKTLMKGSQLPLVPFSPP